MICAGILCVFPLALNAFAQSADPALVKDYYESVSEGKRLEAELLKIEQRLAAFGAAQRAQAAIPPAANSKDVAFSTVRLVRGLPSSLDKGNMGYGSAFVFACAKNAAGILTAYAFTAAHVREFDRPFIDNGGRTNVDLGNTGVRTTISADLDVLYQAGGLFKTRDPYDPSTQDTSVISFPVSSCPNTVISIASSVRAGEPVVMTGFPYTSPDRTKTQNARCAMRTDGGVQPCIVDAPTVPGYSGGPITRQDGQAVGIVSAGDEAMTIADNAAAMRAAAEALCRAKPPKIPYYYVDKKKIDCTA